MRRTIDYTLDRNTNYMIDRYVYALLDGDTATATAALQAAAAHDQANPDRPIMPLLTQAAADALKN